MRVPNLKNAAKSACRVVKAVVKGDPLLLDEQSVRQRLAACEGIPGKTPPCPAFEPSARQCLDCTCLVDLKSQLATEKCPRHRWTTTNRA
jgi:hypothetical protein